MVVSAPAEAPAARRNDPAQYEQLANQWWEPRGPFAMLHWIAAARAERIPPASRPGAVLLDVACGGGLLAPHLAGLGYRHVGVDLSATAARVASERGVVVARGDVGRLPVADGAADLVVAGELLEHVADVEGVVAEMVRLLRPGGTAVFDTIADTRWARLSLVTISERLPGGPPPRIHDPALFVSPVRLRGAFAAHGMEVGLNGLRPHPPDYLRFLLDRSRTVRMVASRSLAGLYQGWGVK